jgi:hypothetical protein
MGISRFASLSDTEKHKKVMNLQAYAVMKTAQRDTWNKAADIALLMASQADNEGARKALRQLATSYRKIAEALKKPK